MMGNENFRLIIEGRNNAYWNMAIDRVLLFSYQDIKMPTLRFYQWEVATLSLGYFQQIPEELIKKCKEKNVVIVRRPTGGKAVLHDDEITYSIVAPFYLFSDERDILRVYNCIARVFMKAFKDMHLQVELVQSKEPSDSSFFCFSEPSYYEITVGGRKIIGSAQRYYKDIFLQHGSLPINRDLALINELFGNKQEEKWTSLEESLGYRPKIQDVYEKIINAFEEIFNFKFSLLSYTSIELDRAKEYENKLLDYMSKI